MFYNSDAMSFGAITVAQYPHRDGVYRISQDLRSFAAIAFRISGWAEFKIGSTSFTSEQGDVMFLGAGIGYDVSYHSSESIYIQMNDCTYTGIENIKLNHPSHIEMVCREIFAQYKRGCSTNVTKSGIYSLLSQIEEDSLMSIPDTIQRCNEYIRENYSRPEMNISEVCRVANISEAGLYRHFKQYYGMSPKQYIQKLRMNSAVNLLSSGNISIEEIAHLTGFQDSKYFSRAFKEHFGLPPSQYRE